MIDSWLKKTTLGRGLLAPALLLAAVNAACAVPAAPEPQDFAWGREINTAGGNAFYRLTLPDDVYQQTAWPDLRDLRVFDQQGRQVSFALRAIEAPKIQPLRVPLTVFPLRIARQSQQEDGNKILALKRPDGTELVVSAPVNETRVRASYLLVAGAEQGNIDLGHITLGWPAGHTSQASGTLLGSDDMKQWQPRADGVPLLDLSADRDRLILNQIDLAEYGASARYWLLLMYAENEQALPPIASAEGIGATVGPEVEQMTLPLKGLDDKRHQQGIYQLTRPQYLSALTIEPAEPNSVLPLAIETRPSPDAAWVALDKRVFYNLEEHPAKPVDFEPARLVQGVRITAIDTQWDDFLPKISGRRPRVELVFNAGGKGPWLLAWGSRAAGDAALPMDALIPGDINSDALDMATLDKRITLGGAARLTEPAPAARRAAWMRYGLWALLAAGALSLAWMAWRLWRDINRAAPPSGTEE